MSDTPERIQASPIFPATGWHDAITAQICRSGVSDEDRAGGWVEYVRADIHDRRADRLRAELAEREAELEKCRAELRVREAQVMSLEKDRNAAGEAYLRMHDIQSTMIGMAQQIQQAPEQRGTISGQAEQPRTDAEWRAADRRKRIFDKTIEAAIRIHAARFAALDSAIYAKQLPSGIPSWSMDLIRETSIAEARALAAAVAEAEE